MKTGRILYDPKDGESIRPFEIGYFEIEMPQNETPVSPVIKAREKIIELNKKKISSNNLSKLP